MPITPQQNKTLFLWELKVKVSLGWIRNRNNNLSLLKVSNSVGRSLFLGQPVILHLSHLSKYLSWDCLPLLQPVALCYPSAFENSLGKTTGRLWDNRVIAAFPLCAGQYTEHFSLSPSPIHFIHPVTIFWEHYLRCWWYNSNKAEKNSPLMVLCSRGGVPYVLYLSSMED